MSAPGTSAGVRERLVEALKLDLIGPWAGHPLAEERLQGWVRPSNWYLTGFLIPSGTAPEKRAELFARADEYGANRVVIGVHYPTDIEASRIAAAVIAAAFMQNPAFMAEFGAAKSELRGVLGL